MDKQDYTLPKEVKDYIAGVENYLFESYITPNINIIREIYVPILIDQIISKNGTIELLGTNTKLNAKEIEKNKNNIINILAKTTNPKNIIVTLPTLINNEEKQVTRDLNYMVKALLKPKILSFRNYLTTISSDTLKPKEMNEEYKSSLKEKALELMPDKFFHIYAKLYKAKTEEDNNKIIAEVNAYSIALLPYIIKDLPKQIGNGKGKIEEFKVGKENIHEYINSCLEVFGEKMEKRRKVLEEAAIKNASKEMSSRTTSRGIRK